MKNIKLLLLLVLVGMFVVGGCGTAISEGVGLAKGPQGNYYQVKDVPPLDGYNNFEVGKITDHFGGAPAELLLLLPGDIIKALQKAEIPVNASGKTAVITGKILFYEKPGTFGKVEQAIKDVVLGENVFPANWHEALDRQTYLYTGLKATQGLEEE